MLKCVNLIHQHRKQNGSPFQESRNVQRNKSASTGDEISIKRSSTLNTFLYFSLSKSFGFKMNSVGRKMMKYRSAKKIPVCM